MNDLTLNNHIENPLHIAKVEFWAATTIFVIAVFSLSTSSSPNRELFEEARVPFYYYQDYFFPKLIKYTLLYLGFFLLNFIVTPKLIKKESLGPSIALVITTFFIVGFGFGILDTYSQNYLFKRYQNEQDAYEFIFQNSFRHAFWLLLMFGIYSFIKHTGLYIFSHSAAIQSKYKMVTRDALIAFVVWMVSMFLLLILGAHGEIVISWGIFALSGIALYCYSFYSLIPQSLGNKRPFLNYLLRVTLILIPSFVAVAVLTVLVIPDDEGAFGISLANVFIQLLITVPLSWSLFKRHLKGNEELYSLKTELKHSNANLDFLRSQINPHFLFNALNTLYGTALQENSDRTAQGIQMLGDMMRFMLHENHQQRILLPREVEYVQNYIDLQLLRTSSSPNIVIETKLAEVREEKFIAPMLLIPFVENAFKHGISLKNKSWIKVTLSCEQNKLYFDVYNSNQPKQTLDPEKGKSGVGLENVRQRLALLYPEKHELIIRETAEEFFVHLTLKL